MTARVIPILGAVAMLFLPVSASSLPVRAYERAELFATCSGRLDALATRQRALSEAGAQDNARLRDEFQILLDAVLPKALSEGVPEAQPRRWRSQGWVEIAALLADVDHSFDPRRADLARAAVLQRISSCRAVLL